MENDDFYAGVKAFAGIDFQEDLWACKNMQALLDTDNADFEELIIEGDQAGLLFRKVMLAWVQEEHGDGPIQ